MNDSQSQRDSIKPVISSNAAAADNHCTRVAVPRKNTECFKKFILTPRLGVSIHPSNSGTDGSVLRIHFKLSAYDEIKIKRF